MTEEGQESWIFFSPYLSGVGLKGYRSVLIERDIYIWRLKLVMLI